MTVVRQPRPSLPLLPAPVAEALALAAAIRSAGPVVLAVHALPPRG